MTIINSVLTGKQPSGTITISSNTTTNVADYEFAVTQVPTTAPAHYVEKIVDANGKLINGTNIINFNGVTDFGSGVLAYAYYQAHFPANISIDLSSLTTISGNNACSNMFNGSSNELTSIDLSSLTTISGPNACQYMFNGCYGITSIDLSSLTTVSGTNACQGMLANCFGITSIDLSGLTTISGQNACNLLFQSSTGLTSINLSGLTTISGGNACSSMFQGCTGLTSVDLSSLTTVSGTGACTNMFQNCSNLTIVKLNALNTMSVQIAPSYGAMFYGCSKLESVEFGGVKASTFSSAVNQIAYLFNNTTGRNATNGCTVHFPSNFDPSDPDHTFDASTLTGYPTFGGNASYIHVAFDLPATES